MYWFVKAPTPLSATLGINDRIATTWIINSSTRVTHEQDLWGSPPGAPTKKIIQPPHLVNPAGILERRVCPLINTSTEIQTDGSIRGQPKAYGQLHIAGTLGIVDTREQTHRHIHTGPAHQQQTSMRESTESDQRGSDHGTNHRYYKQPQIRTTDPINKHQRENYFFELSKPQNFQCRRNFKKSIKLSDVRLYLTHSRNLTPKLLFKSDCYVL